MEINQYWLDIHINTTHMLYRSDGSSHDGKGNKTFSERENEQKAFFSPLQ